MITRLNLNPPGKMSGTTEVIRKRADESQLLEALTTIKITEPARHEISGLGQNIDGAPVVVKIINQRNRGERSVRTERKLLYNAQRLLGCARTADGKYYYLVMPYTGIPYSQNRGLSPEKAKELMLGATKYYEEHYCLRHR